MSWSSSFIFYINDLHPSWKHLDVSMYADDITLTFSPNSMSLINECVNEDLGYLKSLHNTKELSLNIAKIQNLIIGRRQRLKQMEHPNPVKPSFNLDDENLLLIKGTLA